MGLYVIAIACSLPSGEEAEFTHWITASTDADALAGAEAFMTSLGGDTFFPGYFGSGVGFSAAKVSKVDMATGHIISTQVGSTSFNGSGITGNLPPQCAVVATLRTAFASSTERGRYYLPGPSANLLTAAGRLQTTPQTNIAAALVAAHAAEILAGTDNFLVVYSRKNRSTQVVLRLDVGDIIDTQRRRRDKLIEVRIGGNV